MLIVLLSLLSAVTLVKRHDNENQVAEKPCDDNKENWNGKRKGDNHENRRRRRRRRRIRRHRRNRGKEMEEMEEVEVDVDENDNVIKEPVQVADSNTGNSTEIAQPQEAPEAKPEPAPEAPQADKKPETPAPEVPQARLASQQSVAPSNTSPLGDVECAVENNGKASYYDVFNASENHGSSGQFYCGGPVDTEMYAALDMSCMESKVLCGKSATVTYGGKSITVIIKDACVGCGKNQIDLSQNAFGQLEPKLTVGILQDLQWVIQ